MVTVNPDIGGIVNLNGIIVPILASPIRVPLVSPMDLNIPNDDIPLAVDMETPLLDTRLGANADDRLVARDRHLEAEWLRLEHPVDADDEGLGRGRVLDQVVVGLGGHDAAAFSAGGAAVEGGEAVGF